MPEEIITTDAPVTTEETPVVETPVETPETEPAPAATTPSWQDELEKADAKTLRSHPKIAGIIGSEIQRAIQAEKDRIKADEGIKAAREAEQNLRRLAEEDPVTFAETWLSETQQKDIQNQIDELRGKTRHELASAIGRAYADVPEWAELSEDDHANLAKAVMGKSDDEVIPLFNQKALDLVADRRAKRLFEQWREKELPKERDAIRQEEAAKLLKDSEPPSTAKPKGQPARLNVKDLTDADFDKFWGTP